jgi:hypothetical protein
MNFAPPYFTANFKQFYKKRIKAFPLEGIFKNDSEIISQKEIYYRLLDTHMRESGYVPVLDLDPQFNLEYNHEKDNYNFTYVVFGVYIGKKKSLQYVGYSANVLIPR